ncbi:MAG: hypothetical protein LBC63_09490 [Holophagales bacterium]|jgi:hypothetical protein|nr:hypothetical protein [Holophagales bacterium]
MRLHGTLAHTLLLALLFLCVPLGAQEKTTRQSRAGIGAGASRDTKEKQTIVVLPPLVTDKDISDGMRNATVAGFSEYISAPSSGYKLYDGLSSGQIVKELARLVLQSIEGKSEAQLMREMERSGSLYDEVGAKVLGEKLGVPYVCISKLMKEAKVVLECKVINVETGAVRGDSEYVSGGIGEMRNAGVAVIKRLLETDEATYAKAEAEAMAAAAAAAAAARAALEAQTAEAGGQPSVYTISRNAKEWHYWKDDREVEPYRYDGFSVGMNCQSGGESYMAGKTGNRTVIAKNGSLFHYLTDGSYEADISAILVSNGSVYAGGGEKNKQGNNVATVWKDGKVLYRLTNGNGDAMVYAVFIYNGDVYAGGRDKNSKGISVATIWKNGLVLHSLTDGKKNAEVDALYVTGNIVYSGGWETNGSGGLGLVWKNGSVMYRLNPGGDTSAVVRSLFVQGTDVFASGFSGAKRDTGFATVWKNGKTLHRLNSAGFNDRSLVFVDEESYAKAEVEAMAMAAAAAARAAAELEAARAAQADDPSGPSSVYTIYRNGDEWHYWEDAKEVEPYRYDGFSIGPYCQSDGDTYKGTWIDYRSAITKNGSLLHFLTHEGQHEGDIRSVVVSDGNVYAGGSERNRKGNTVATVWKNDSVLYRLTDGSRDALVLAVFVSDGDVYAGGREKNAKGINVATVWKNGRVLYRLVEEGDKRGGAGVRDRVADAGNAAVNALFVTGGDVYASRWDTDTRKDGNLGMIWKNGKELRTLNLDGKSSVTVWSIFVHGSDVYASGFQGYTWKEPGTAIVWKNGEVLHSFNSTGYDDSSLVFVSNKRPPLDPW